MSINKAVIKSIAIFLSIVACFSGAAILASPPAPTPTCKITGAIKLVHYQNAYDEACLASPSGCPTDRPVRHPARYFLDIEINRVSYISGDTTFNTCVKMYPVGSMQKIFVDKDKVKSHDAFSVNQIIEGAVSSFWDKSFDSYILATRGAQKYFQNLRFGMINSAVSLLQTDLSMDTSIYPEKLITGYFGKLTLKAVKRFQAKHGIPQTGFVGPLTRSKLNDIYTPDTDIPSPKF
ncbi:MAG: peptidoglycan-binding domain-containing protein [Patescibacteria group bacterium]